MNAFREKAVAVFLDKSGRGITAADWGRLIRDPEYTAPVFRRSLPCRRDAALYWVGLTSSTESKPKPWLVRVLVRRPQSCDDPHRHRIGDVEEFMESEDAGKLLIAMLAGETV